MASNRPDRAAAETRIGFEMSASRDDDRERRHQARPPRRVERFGLTLAPRSLETSLHTSVARPLSLAAMTALVLACSSGGARTEPHRPGPADARPEPTRAAPPTALEDKEPQVSPELEALLTERDSLLDWRNTFFQRPQTRPKSFRPLLSRGTFPFRRIASARAFTFGYALQPCDEEAIPFAKDGTLCPNVVAPGVELSSPALERAVNLVKHADEAFQHDSHVGRPVTRCEFDPHHAIVFYDQGGAPLAKLVVCFTCGEILAVPGSPAMGKGAPALMMGNERATLAELFDEARLGAWLFDETKAERLSAYEADVYGRAPNLTKRGLQRRRERVAKGSGVAGDKSVRDLDAPERARLCTWFGEELAARDLRDGPRWERGYECTDGRRRTLGSFASCSARPMTCDVPVARVEACLSTFLRPLTEICDTPEPEACAGLATCLPI